MSSHPTRRRFFALAGSAGVAAMLPTKAVWPARVGGSKLRIAFYTDVHARTEWQTPEALRLAAAAVNRSKADVVIAGGDLITDGFQSAAEEIEPRWSAYLQMHESIKPRVFPVIGNHDLVAANPADGSQPSEDPRQPFKKLFGLERTYRSFDADGYHIILLDAIEVVGGELQYIGKVGRQQLEWIQSDLARVNSETPIIVASHMPFFTSFFQATEGSESAAPANRVVTNSLEVLKLFENHNLLLMLQGHLHVDELLRFKDTTFITGGAVCGKWWRGAWHGTPNGFGVVTLKRGRVEWQYQPLAWEPKRP